MKINADFNRRALVHSADLEWLSSPMPGVYRRPLDRVGDEVARATSIVRYAPGSHFSAHVHTGGEEFLVLDGVFQDEHGDFPTGCYCRNPPQSSHTPRSEQGCILFVKLWQFDTSDRTHVLLNSNFMKPAPSRDRPGVTAIPLYSDDNEEVEIQYWQSDTRVILDAQEGIELLVLAGSLEEGADTLKKDSWLRLPPGKTLNATAGSLGAKVWIKRNHLKSAPAQIQNVLNAI